MMPRTRSASARAAGDREGLQQQKPQLAAEAAGAREEAAGAEACHSPHAERRAGESEARWNDSAVQTLA